MQFLIGGLTSLLLQLQKGGTSGLRWKRRRSNHGRQRERRGSAGKCFQDCEAFLNL
jgi:hypothetical protein